MSSRRSDMQTSLKRLALVVILFVGIGTLSGCASGGGSYGPNAAFLEAARSAGAPVRAEEIVTHSSGDQTVTIAPITTWERTPATQLRNGVNVAFAHLSRGTGQVPA